MGLILHSPDGRFRPRSREVNHLHRLQQVRRKLSLMSMDLRNMSDLEVTVY